MAIKANQAKRDEFIRLAHKEGVSVRRIAETVGITFGRVAQIIRGE